jgi:serine/threonine-protein kinase RsbW
VELYVDNGVEGAEDTAARVLLEHLRRHAELDELVDLAEPMVHASVHGPPQTRRWIGLDWSDRSARMRVASLDPELPAPTFSEVDDDGTVSLGPGVLLAQDVTRQLATTAQLPGIEIELPVIRPPEESIDPVATSLPDGATGGRESFLAAATTLLAGPVASGRSERERAAILGASLAELLRSRGAVSTDPTAAEAADALIAAEEQLGGDFFVMEADERRAVLGNRRCPFAIDGTPPSPTMCRFTSALGGRLAAGGSRGAHVVLDERLASGDHRCRIEIRMDPPPSPDAGHLYSSPPAGLPATDGPDLGGDAHDVTPGFRVALSLVLPRDKHSVVLARRLARHALDEVGAIEDHAHDVELALAEAAANVIEHSGPGDRYRVSVEVLPRTCELRVIDVGRGFDHESLSREMAHVSAEEGRGIALMHALMDQVRFNAHPEQGTIVHLVKGLAFDDRSPIRRSMLNALESGESP